MKERLKSPRARMFIALELPAAARDALAVWQRELHALSPDELRTAKADTLHVTLAFLGHRPLRDSRRIAAEIDPVARSHDAIELTFLADLVPRPARKPRFYASAVNGTPQLLGLRSDVAGRLVHAHLFEEERRDFWPHVTLCRVKSSVRTHRAPEELPAAPVELNGHGFTASQLTLYNSELLPQGARHTPLARFALGEGAVSGAA